MLYSRSLHLVTVLVKITCALLRILSQDIGQMRAIQNNAMVK